MGYGIQLPCVLHLWTLVQNRVYNIASLAYCTVHVSVVSFGRNDFLEQCTESSWLARYF